MAFEQKRDDRDILSGFALITPFRMYLVARNSNLLHANNKGADQPAHPRSQLALESTLHAKNENKKFYRQTCVCQSRQLQRGRGGGDCFSMEVRTRFSSRKYMTTCNFAKNENKKFYRQTCVCRSRQLQRGRGGGDCFSMEVRTRFSSRKYMTTCNFPGGGPGPLRPPPPPAPSVSAQIKVSNSL